MSSRFDLEKAISAWRRPFEHNRAFSAEDIEELEGSLRDRVAALVEAGLTEEAAFRAALRRTGSYATAEAEYRKVYWGKMRRRRQLLPELIGRLTMLTNYLKIAWRTLQRHRSYTFINVAGLGVGLACCLLILGYVQHELSFDRFHPHRDRLYRVALEQLSQNQATASVETPPILAETLVRDFPEVVHATRLWRDWSGRMALRYGTQRFFEDGVLFADSNFFEVFGFRLLRGDPRTVLASPFSILLTETTAAKYFGSEDPMGKTITLREPSDRDLFEYRVTGIVADPPAASHLRFDFLASYASQRASRSETWLGADYFDPLTYVVLRPGADPAALEARFPGLIQRYVAPQFEENRGLSLAQFQAAGNGFRYFLQPVPRIHLHSDLAGELQPNGDATYVVLFGTVALFILLLAGINFTNLATAQSAGRAREVGVRKVLGSQRRQLVGQFLTESVLLSLAALLLAVTLVHLLMLAFDRLTGISLSLPDLAILLPGLLAFGLFTGLLAGLYPAYFLSGFPPVAVLKRSRQGPRSSALRNSLVVFQFAVSILLIAGTLVVYNQMDYMRSKKLGFRTDQVVVIEGAEVLGRQGETFRQRLRDHAGIAFVSNAEKVPGRSFDTARFRAEGTAEDDRVLMPYTYASFDFVETLGLELVSGRSLSRTTPGDSLGVILNETAVARLGLEHPIGTRLIWPNESTYTIVGVVKDFHFASLHETIGPFALLGPDPCNTNRPNLLITARLRTDDLPAALAFLRRTWGAFAPQQPFSYSFLDADLDALYRAEARTARLLGLFTLLAIGIACLGLFGLASFTAQQRTKEIGVRKVLGASVGSVVALLSTDFLKLIGLAFLVAAPLAYFGMERWLDDFAYRIEMSWQTFLIAGLAALGVALVTVSYQSIKAALVDPVKSLRYE